MASRLPKLNLNLGGGPAPLKGIGGVDFDVAKINFDQAIQNLDVVGEFITYQVAQAVVDSLVTILAYAQPRVPYYPGGDLGDPSTGDLRRSGTATIALNGQLEVVATGNVDGTINVNNTGISPSAFKRKKIDVILGFIDYNRISERGMLDIALWTHENLNPYEGRPGVGKGRKSLAGSKQYYARSPGTGPKYLELAWIQNKRDILGYIEQIVKKTPEALKSMIVKQGRQKKYTVDEVKLVMKESSRRYFKGTSLGGKFKGRGVR